MTARDTAKKITCPSCNTQLTARWKSCPVCGAEIPREAPPTPAPRAPDASASSAGAGGSAANAGTSPGGMGGGTGLAGSSTGAPNPLSGGHDFGDYSNLTNPKPTSTGESAMDLYPQVQSWQPMRPDQNPYAAGYNNFEGEETPAPEKKPAPTPERKPTAPPPAPEVPGASPGFGALYAELLGQRGTPGVAPAAPASPAPATPLPAVSLPPLPAATAAPANKPGAPAGARKRDDDYLAMLLSGAAGGTAAPPPPPAPPAPPPPDVYEAPLEGSAVGSSVNTGPGGSSVISSTNIFSQKGSSSSPRIDAAKYSGAMLEPEPPEDTGERSVWSDVIMPAGTGGDGTGYHPEPEPDPEPSEPQLVPEPEPIPMAEAPPPEPDREKSVSVEASVSTAKKKPKPTLKAKPAAKSGRAGLMIVLVMLVLFPLAVAVLLSGKIEAANPYVAEILLALGLEKTFPIPTGPVRPGQGTAVPGDPAAEMQARVQEHIQFLSANDAKTREQAMLGLAKMGAPAVPALAAVLAEPRNDVRIAASEALSRIGPDAAPAVPALAVLLSGTDGDVRLFAAKALLAIGGPAVPELIEALHSEDPNVRLLVVRGLAQYPEDAKAGRESLLNLLGDRMPPIRAEAAIALSKMGPDTVPLLVERLSEDRPEVRQAAASSLARFGEEAAPAVPALIEMVAGDSANDRAVATSALTKIGTPAVPEVVKLLGHDEPKVQNAAVDILKWVRPEPVAALVESLQDKDHRVRYNSAAVLGAFGPAAKDALPALQKALADSNFDVRSYVKAALQKIDR